jgi:hypothetical protein
MDLALGGIAGRQIDPELRQGRGGEQGDETREEFDQSLHDDPSCPRSTTAVFMR